eukprot:TRINITY_DN19726_c0_g1_i1.p1 TRINITY_DN19726_c0_g1~~TRINITY_DN19726_c0_g1_i1.p1  ORF type:complete len:305 (+),score=112.14 TRINITY_DN19726_c0_g1_i1:94-1008(+)
MCITFTVTLGKILSEKCFNTYTFFHDNIQRLPAEGFVSGYVGGLLGRAAVIPLDPELKAPMAQMVRGKTGTQHSLAVLYRFAPYWGLRLSLYSNSTCFFGNNNADTNTLLMFPSFFLTGAWAEMWTRMICNPFAKVRYHRDLGIAAGNPKESIPSTMVRMFNEKGGLIFFQDTAKYRVECMRMGVLFGVYNTLRNPILSVTGDPGDAPLYLKVPVDLVCGGVAGAASVAATHSLRVSTYDNKSVFAQRSMQHAMRMEAPLAAVAITVYGLGMALLRPDFQDAGFSGWETIHEEITEYGGHVHKH